MTREAIGRQFARNLSEARGWAGLTQTQLGEQVSLSQKEISRLEQGAIMPRLDTLVALASSLGVLVRDLLFEIE
ncbi:MAG: helix-turn-helix transcriptional regulator [Solirubrobacterales bacterium]